MMSSTLRPGRSRHPGRLGLLQVALAGVLWGTAGVAVTVLHERDGIGAMTASAWRMAIAAVALVVFAALSGRLGAVAETMRTHPGLAILVGCGTGVYQGLYFVSVLMVGVGVATVVSLGLAPILASAWEHARARTTPSPREVAVVAAALTGLVLITATAGEGTPAPGGQPALGLVLALVAGATYAATTVLGHTVAQRAEPVALTTCATTAGAVLLLPFLGLAAATAEPVLPSSPGSLLLLAYLGVATMALSYGLLYAGLRTTSGSAATVATLLEPLAAAVLAALLLAERLPWPSLVGGGLILAAVLGLQPKPEPPTLA
ncbi:EamA family transporter [Intrasporangium calvum]|uniref:EamA family transporter n=1 Tax=Intrasporangium calvum TaxID=53358 RepID=A0ABT5GG10_9MICO|nr:EamA family transporter [Intrasporangium calvum]MDC5697059.1 EamA family transporter [Intrasporangium calvum]